MSTEKEIVSRSRGERLARAWAESPQELDMPDTLLSSEEIKKVVEATGLISPFFIGGDRQARLKKASYEGRIGSKAYIYRDENIPEQIFDRSKDESLIVERNSIVFVECDLDFRLPDFIALRFNLQIQHVHRGLLLGTGPIVDPGYWGKLCIPLHNLTDKDYAIPKDQGLIWIEFTKTTLPSNAFDSARAALEAGPKDVKEHWDIEKFLHKAASQYTGLKVPIRSSLPTMFDEANAAATKSAAEAEAARADAKAALEAADKLRSYNFLSMIGAAVGFIAVTFAASAFLFNLSSRNEELSERIKNQSDATKTLVSEHVAAVDHYDLQPAEIRANIPELRGKILQQELELEQLRKDLKDLKNETYVIRQRARLLPPPPYTQ